MVTFHAAEKTLLFSVNLAFIHPSSSLCIRLLALVLDHCHYLLKPNASQTQSC